MGKRDNNFKVEEPRGVRKGDGGGNSKRIKDKTSMKEGKT